MAEEFYNPYQFIPVTGTVNGNPTPTVPFEAIKQGEDPDIRHDLWRRDHYSGRIVCKVHLETPTVVGNCHAQPDSNAETIVRPYTIGGELALPASSLRGMISSVVETLSQSALRVLKEERYSVRKAVGRGLSALGAIRKEIGPQGQPRYFLVPLTLPTINVTDPNLRIRREWQNLLPSDGSLRDWLGAYIDGYETSPHAPCVPTGFLADKQPVCGRYDQPIFYYARLGGSLRNCAIHARIDRTHNSLRVKEMTGSNGEVSYFLTGQKIQRNEVLTQAEYDGRTSGKQHYTRGLLYVLGGEGRRDIPETKRHERFIPMPEGKIAREMEIPAPVVENFLAVAYFRRKTEAGLPFLPKGYDNARRDSDFLANGDLIYFAINSWGNITEISYSSIWRRPVEGTIHDAFAAIGQNLLPWGYGDRDSLTPAEALFGVVEGRKDRPAPDSRNLASRVRFSDARSPNEVEQLHSGNDEGSFRLKILSSPKPPSPALYFRGGPRKQDLRLTAPDQNPDKPNGRKVYLPHEPGRAGVASGHRPEWEGNDEHKAQKTLCRPLAPGQEFYFAIDFDNLTNAELTLLLAALEPDLDPGSGFVHRLGLGKPLGLGSVSVRVGGVFLIDRIGRYGLEAQPRYRWRLDGHFDENLCQAAAGLGLCPSHSPEPWLWNSDDALIDNDSRGFLKTVGNLRPDDRLVHYPFCTREQVRDEKEGYEWFVSNDKPQAHRQCLRPVVAGTDLPRLITHRRP